MLSEGLKIFPAETAAPLERKMLFIFEEIDCANRITQVKGGGNLVGNREDGHARRLRRGTLKQDLEVRPPTIDVTDRDSADRLSGGGGCGSWLHGPSSSKI